MTHWAANSVADADAVADTDWVGNSVAHPSADAVTDGVTVAVANSVADSVDAVTHWVGKSDPDWVAGVSAAPEKSQIKRERKSKVTKIKSKKRKNII